MEAMLKRRFLKQSERHYQDPSSEGHSAIKLSLFFSERLPASTRIARALRGNLVPEWENIASTYGPSVIQGASRFNRKPPKARSL